MQPNHLASPFWVFLSSSCLPVFPLVLISLNRPLSLYVRSSSSFFPKLSLSCFFPLPSTRGSPHSSFCLTRLPYSFSSTLTFRRPSANPSLPFSWSMFRTRKTARITTGHTSAFTILFLSPGQDLLSITLFFY